MKTTSANKRAAQGVIAAVVVAALLGMAVAHPARGQNERDVTLAHFSGEQMLADIRVLSSDQFQGRGPGTEGEKLTIAYVKKQFRAAGLEPGNPDGTYLQTVPMIGIRPSQNVELTFSGAGVPMHAAYEKDFIAGTRYPVKEAKLDAQMVFAGYGVQAPEYKWDDFKGMDVKGKVLVVLVNDPQIKKDGQLDPKMFGGKAMTYYGRWTYKYEEAERLGAAGCLIVHETVMAAYPWEVVRDSWAGERFTLPSADPGTHSSFVQGWLTHEEAQALFKAAGYDFAALKEKALSLDFHPVALKMRGKIEIQNEIRTIESHNVVAKLSGSDPTLKNEYVIYSAHWDHFGIGPEVNGDKIYHGALDNGSGSAALMELGRAFASLKIRPKRSILFLSDTGEEQGLIGSEYYAEHPLYPLSRTAADINMDGMNVLGKTRDITEVGMGESSLDEVVAAVAREQGRTVRSDPEPEKGSYYRSDHFSFAKVGVPAFDPGSGIDYIGKPAGWGMKMRAQFTAHDYHKPSDVIKPYWKMDGAEQDCALFFGAGYRVANAPQMPVWKTGSEFKAIREKSLRGD